MKTLAPVLLLTFGCQSLNPDSWGFSGGCRTHSTDSTLNCGIAELTHNKQPYLVLITGGGESSLSGWTWTQASGQIKQATGHIKADGREVAWSCDTKAGETGNLVIGGRTFRLEDGRVVLVDLRGGKLGVVQSAVDMGQFGGDEQRIVSVEEQLKSLAATDTRIAQFLRVCESPR
jgi:hypothetical protein